MKRLNVECRMSNVECRKKIRRGKLRFGNANAKAEAKAKTNANAKAKAKAKAKAPFFLSCFLSVILPLFLSPNPFTTCFTNTTAWFYLSFTLFFLQTNAVTICFLSLRFIDNRYASLLTLASVVATALASQPRFWSVLLAAVGLLCVAVYYLFGIVKISPRKSFQFRGSIVAAIVSNCRQSGSQWCSAVQCSESFGVLFGIWHLVCVVCVCVFCVCLCCVCVCVCVCFAFFLFSRLAVAPIVSQP